MSPDSLIDFPVSWTWHRQYCEFYGQPDPGPNHSPTASIEYLAVKLATLEDAVMELSLQPDLQNTKEAQRIKSEVNYLIKKLNEHLDRSRTRRKDKI